MTTDAFGLVDGARSVDLGSQYVAATVVDSDGRECLVLAEIDSLGDAAVTYDQNCIDVEHEQVGALPERYRLGLAAVPIRCGRPTQAGHPCRTPVSEPGPCHHHAPDPVIRTAKENQR